MNDKKYFLEMSIENLAHVTEEVNATKEMIKHLTEEVEKLPIMQKITDLKDHVKKLDDQIKTIRDEITPEAIAMYEETGEKNLVEGLSIRVYKVVDYEDDKALEYCIEKDLKTVMRIDKRAFDKYLKGIEEVAPPPFVTYRDDPKPSISSDLTAYLGRLNGD